MSAAIQIANQALGIAQDSSGIPFGILGASKFKEQTVQENATFIENLANLSIVKRLVFGLDMRGVGSDRGMSAGPRSNPAAVSS